MTSVTLRPELRPRLRGVSHQWAFIVAVPLGIALTLAADGASATIACAIYALTVAGLFGVSATYHRVTWKTNETRERMRRLDHSMIFLLIAGSYTPFSVIAIDGTLGTVILCVVWAGALAGVLIATRYSDAPGWVTTVPYIALGWVAIIALPGLVDSIGWVALSLVILSGVLYTIGGIVYARKRPNPFPYTFGYHEIFHVLVIAAAALQYIVVAFWVI